MKNRLFLNIFVVFLFLISERLISQNETNSSPKIKRLISKKRAFNKTYGYGFRVQVYYGDETEARKIQNKFKISFPNVYTKLAYNKPDWKVHVGNYKTKLEADKALITFSEKFTGLIVIPLGK
ncbi:MAG: SPOR domain-containing protein [Polaribacter sp.]|nr:SPOR domain-containing protein [Polaribacter sp.]